MTTETIMALADVYTEAERHDYLTGEGSVEAHRAALLAAVESMAAKLEAAKSDAARLDWIEKALFRKSWNGVMGSGSKTNWRVLEGYRHVVQKMVGNTFREAIDAAAGAAHKEQT